MTTTAPLHRHAPSPAPLVIRLRDLAPHLSHRARARLALDRIVDHVDALDAARDRAAAYALLAQMRSDRRPVEEFTATVVVPQAAVFPHGVPARTTRTGR